MTRYTVTWRRGALNHLAQIWTDTADQPAVTAAANAMDAELATEAPQKGQPVSEGLRALYVPPLHVLFAVSEPDRLVEVVSVRSDQPSSPTSQKNGQSPPPS
jgi:plasmid stabilization system protein ParE